jgi:hypothetical protein
MFSLTPSASADASTAAGTPEFPDGGVPVAGYGRAVLAAARRWRWLSCEGAKDLSSFPVRQWPLSPPGLACRLAAWPSARARSTEPVFRSLDHFLGVNAVRADRARERGNEWGVTGQIGFLSETGTGEAAS